MSVGTLDWLFVVQEVEAPASGGYLIIGDDTVISHCMIKDFNKSMVSWPFVQDASIPSLLASVKPQSLKREAIPATPVQQYALLIKLHYAGHTQS